MNILGISCFYHDSAACLIRDVNSVFAAQEERFNREKNSSLFPVNAINYCLQAGQIGVADIDYIVFYEKPFLKFHRIISGHLSSYPFSLSNFLQTIPLWLEDRLSFPFLLKRELGYEGEVLFIKHHLSHAASAFLPSPFSEAAIITADGVGEWGTTAYGFGSGREIKILGEIRYPDSLGLLYTAVTTYLGFEALRGEGKVMALASYGKPSYMEAFNRMAAFNPDGSFRLDPHFFGINTGQRMYTKRLCKLLGPERKPQDNLLERHYDIAATLQEFLEQVIVKIAGKAQADTGMDKLCLAGGVFLNCASNSRILRDTPFRDVFIQPASGDSGGALGAALYACNKLLGTPRNFVMRNAYLGPEFTNRQVKSFLVNHGIKFSELPWEELAVIIAGKVAQDKIIGWFQGRMEWGPRALGNRSILANPANPGMRDYLNSEVKHREWFRPYGVSVLAEEAGDFFHVNYPSPFMLLLARVREEKKAAIPSAVHVDGTSRLQMITEQDNPMLYLLVKKFRGISGIPMVINTSFNDKGEPLVCSPEDAYNCFKKTRIDYLVMGNCLVEK